MKKFQKFLEELDIVGHSGIPGQGGKREGEPNYLSDVEARAKQRLGIERLREGDPRLMGIINTMMSSSDKLKRLGMGKEKELEKLATEVLNKLYKPAIDAYGIKLDLKLISSSDMKREQEKTSFWDWNKIKEYSEKEKGKTPIVRARGIDFGVLLHEAVKGIWQVLSSGAVPKDKELAAEIKKKITYTDEPQDWRYGPEIASDLRDFINDNPLTDRVSGIREELWKEMCNEDTMSSDEFVELMRGILAKNAEARKKVDSMIANIAKRLEKWHKEWSEYERQMAEYNMKMKDYERQMAEWSKKRKNINKEKAKKPKPETEAEIYEEMTKRELDAEINRALDTGDYDLVSKLSEIKERKFGE